MAVADLDVRRLVLVRLLADGPAVSLRRLMEERSAIYEELAKVVVDVDGLDEYEAAGAVVQAVLG